jgi:hypothetical protein
MVTPAAQGDDRDSQAVIYREGLTLEEVDLVHDRGASTKITRWACQQVARQGGQVWVSGKTLVELGEEWEAS